MNDNTRAEAIALCESRAGLYHLIATLYFQPLSQEQIDALAASDIADAASEEGSPSPSPAPICPKRCACAIPARRKRWPPTIPAPSTASVP